MTLQKPPPRLTRRSSGGITLDDVSKLAGVSAITNLAEGLSPFPLSHEQTLKYAAIAAKDMVTLIHGFIERLGQTTAAA